MPEKLYAVGDVHGQMTALTEAMRRITVDGGAGAQVVFVGDLVDRGPDSKAVIQYLMDGQARGENWTVLYGNHDRLFVWFMQNGTVHDDCIKSGLTWDNDRLGGLATLASYGVDISRANDLAAMHAEAVEKVPADHINWLKVLPRSYETETHFFAHAGIRPTVPLADQTEDDLLWIRQEFHRDTAPHPKMIVHGHTPVDCPTQYTNRINIDGGAGYGRPIFPMVIEGKNTFLLDSETRIFLAKG